MASRELRHGRSRPALVGVLLIVLGLVPVPTGGAALPPADGLPLAAPAAPLRDLDGDRVDDLLTAVDGGLSTGRFPDGLKRLMFDVGADSLVFDVFVRFTGGVDDLDAARVSFVANGRETRVFPLAEAVWVRAVPAALFDDLLAVPGASFIDADRVVLPAADDDAQTHVVRRSTRYGRGATERFRVTGVGVTVAVLDTGIDDEHRTFEIDRGIGGYDATHWFFRDGETNRKDPDSQDTFTHGTYVAGVAVGAGVPKQDDQDVFSREPLAFEKQGIAPDARYLDVKVMATDPEGNAFGLGTEDVVAGTSSMVLEGLEFVRRFNAGESHHGNITPREVDVVLMSLAETEPDPGGNSTLAFAVDNLTETAGVIVVAAAGNCGPGAARAATVWDVVYSRCGQSGLDTIAAPGSAKSAITVAALDTKETLEWDDDDIASFSSRGPRGGEDKPNVAASGVHVEGPFGRPTRRDELYRWEPADAAFQNLSGTSPAAAIVAGVVALMREADPHLSADRAKQILMVTARDVGAKGWDALAGAGAVDAYDAVGVALGLLDESLFNGTKEEGPKTQPPEIPRPPTRPPVRVNRAPIVDFEVTPQPAMTGERIRFTDRSRDPEGDVLVSWAWDFGDGSSGSGQNATHVYRRPGVYTVRLSVTDGNISNSSSNVGREEVIVKGKALGRDAPDVGAGMALALLFTFVLVAARARGRPSDLPTTSTLRRCPRRLGRRRVHRGV